MCCVKLGEKKKGFKKGDDKKTNEREKERNLMETKTKSGVRNEFRKMCIMYIYNAKYSDGGDKSEGKKVKKYSSVAR